ncbi:MAG TPA: SDR family NAD(P)-dependent oxidoreductase [Solirubrobacter sp.]|nr:SDR family NAD(P)-dependent oxidoreductase [Solirubrobacter sp.]
MPSSSERPVAVVTGAARGLGRAEALRFAESGAAVVVNDLDAAGLEDTVAAVIDRGGSALAQPGDVTDEHDADALIEAAVAHYGRLDALVNNAGITADRMVFNLSKPEWDSVIAVNLTGTFLPTRAAARHWRAVAKATGRPAGAAIVNTTSRAGLFGNPGQANYGSAKSGVATLAMIVARELRRYGVRCNAVAPRAFTPLMRQSFGDFRADEVANWSPEAIARIVVHLAGPESEPITGQTLLVQGRRVSLIAPWHEVAAVELGGDGLADELASLFDAHPAAISEFEVTEGLPLVDPRPGR